MRAAKIRRTSRTVRSSDQGERTPRRRWARDLARLARRIEQLQALREEKVASRLLRQPLVHIWRRLAALAAENNVGRRATLEEPDRALARRALSAFVGCSHVKWVLQRQDQLAIGNVKSDRHRSVQTRVMRT